MREWFRVPESGFRDLRRACPGVSECGFRAEEAQRRVGGRRELRGDALGEPEAHQADAPGRSADGLHLVALGGGKGCQMGPAGHGWEGLGLLHEDRVRGHVQVADAGRPKDLEGRLGRFRVGKRGSGGVRAAEAKALTARAGEGMARRARASSCTATFLSAFSSSSRDVKSCGSDQSSAGAKEHGRGFSLAPKGSCLSARRRLEALQHAAVEAWEDHADRDACRAVGRDARRETWREYSQKRRNGPPL